MPICTRFARRLVACAVMTAVALTLVGAALADREQVHLTAADQALARAQC